LIPNLKYICAILCIYYSSTMKISRLTTSFVLGFLSSTVVGYSAPLPNSPPSFEAAIAYQHIQQQVSMGPRVPNTAAHRLCAAYLHQTLAALGAQVHVQHFQAQAFDGTMLQLQNIIARFNPTCPQRILLAAHWDTRPFADKDTQCPTQPIQGANDGASGVGVLLAIAQVVSSHPLEDLGLDIILFDGEDYGAPHSTAPTAQDATYWCLGAQYWASHPHVPHYTATYGILLDMVGAPGATFYREHYSMLYADSIVRKIWSTACQLGYAQYFIPQNSQGAIWDDHVWVNQLARIPMVDIIDHWPMADPVFKAYHHTHADNLALIDKATLQAVGDTLLHVLYTAPF